MAKSKINVSKNSEELAEALGFSPSKALEWEVRLQLTNEIIKAIKSKGLTVSEVAKSVGTSRARITKILKNETDGISIDILLRVVGSLGRSVKLSFKKAA